MPYLPRKFRKGEPVLASDLNALDEEVVRLGRMSITGGLSLLSGPSGWVIGLSRPSSTMPAVAATGGISAGGSGTLGEGNAILRERTGTALADGATVKVYNNLSTGVIAGVRLVIAPYGDDYLLVSADCP